MRIGELSRQTAVPARLLRYYEEQGLLSPARDANGYRDYSAADVARVRQIRGLLDSGLPTGIIRRILPVLCAPEEIYPDCLADETAGLIRDEVTRLTERIDCLARNRDALAAYVTAIGKDQAAPWLPGDGTVRRPAGPWTPAVHALLRHLERAGFTGAPRVVGFDSSGREVLTYIPGSPVDPHSWSDEGIWRVGRLLRDLHDATAGFRPPPDATWHPWPFGSDAPDAIISHRDTGPWNIVARDGLPVAFVDWPTAGPTARLDEIAATAWLNAQLHDDDIAFRHGLPAAEARAAQVRLFADGYGLGRPDREALTGAMIDYAIRDSAAEAQQARVTPDGGDASALWAISWRARSAAWMVRHRPLLERVLMS